MRKFILIVALLFALAAPVVAQEPTFTPEPTIALTDEPVATESPDEVVNVTTDEEGNIDVTAPDATGDYPIIDPAATVATIVNAVSGLVMAAFGAAPITVVVVSLLKRIPALNAISAPTMTFAVASVLYVGAILASVTGMQVQYESLLDFITTAAPAVVSFLATLIGAPAIHRLARTNNVALIGDSRTPPITYVSDGNTIYAVQTDIPNGQVN